MKTKNILIQSSYLSIDSEDLLNVSSNKVLWYRNNRLNWVRQYLGVKCYGIDIYYYKNGRLHGNKVHKNGKYT